LERFNDFDEAARFRQLGLPIVAVANPGLELCSATTDHLEGVLGTV
jgi:hypothetical protein